MMRSDEEARFGIGWEYACIVLDAKSRVESVFGGPATSFLEPTRLFEPRSYLTSVSPPC